MMDSWFGQSVGLGLGTMIGFGIIAAIIAIVIIFLKGYALWHAARRNEKWWFVALLLINTIGILELIYLYFVVGKWHNFSESNSNKDISNNSNPASAV